MARRRKDDSPVLGAIIIAVGAVLYFALRLVATAVVYLTPLAYLAALAVATARDDKPPILPDPKDWRLPNERRRRARLVARLNALAQQFEALNREGEDAGLVHSKASNGTRFREHAKLAKVINARLDETQAEFGNKRQILAELKQNCIAGLPDWRAELEAYAHRRASVSALIVAFGVYSGGLLVCFSLARVAGVRFGSGLNDFLVVRALPAWTVGPVLGVSVLSFVVLAIVWKVGSERLKSSIDPDFLSQWDAVEGYWLTDDFADEDGEDEYAADADDGDAEQEEPRRRSAGQVPPNVPAWYEVLDVSEDASAKEIQAAWMQIVKKYHPDQVAHLGDKLQVMAAAETAAANAARDEGLRSRQRS